MLSIVATSRNDDHGGNLLRRMQAFVDGFAEQCRRHTLEAELILVEWNPPADRPPLAEALHWPQGDGAFTIRIIRVPPAMHARLACSDRLPLFQMIAKNVGIRRARGDFVLATNIDILFSDALVRFMRDRLRRSNLYRVDRYDVPGDIPVAASVATVLEFCKINTFRINRRDGVYMIKERKLYPIHETATGLMRAWAESAWRGFTGLCHQAARQGLLAVRRGLGWRPWRPWRLPRLPRRTRRAGHGFMAALVGALRRSLERGTASVVSIVVALRRLFEIPRLHTNACGDFTLMARDDWFRMRGYPEWEIFSWHLDSVLVHQAYGNGLRIVELDDPMRAYHIEHGLGSGWSREGEEFLFARLERAGITCLSNDDFVRIARKIRADAKTKRPIVFNDDGWGFACVELPEEVVCAPALATRPSVLAGGT